MILNCYEFVDYSFVYEQVKNFIRVLKYMKKKMN